MALLEEMRKDLSAKVGGRDFMTPSELEKYVIPIPVRQQTQMRYERRFPIAHHKVGKAVFYSVQAIAEYVVKDKKETTTKILSSDLNTKGRGKLAQNRKQSSNDSSDFDLIELSNAFFLKSVLEDLKEELARKNDLKRMLEQFVDSKDLHDDLQENLPVNKEVVREKKVIKI